MKLNRRGTTIIAILVALLIIGVYTLQSYAGEPRPLNPNISSISYTENLAGENNGSTSTLFFHTFALDGSNATYGFCLQAQMVPAMSYYFPGNSVHEVICMTKIHQQLAFPFSSFLLRVDYVNMTISINNTQYGSADPIQQLGGFLTPNKTAVQIGFSYDNPSIGIAVNGLAKEGYENTIYVNSYNLTYTLEVTPIVEFGPYYTIGKSVWVSHTFVFPYAYN